MLEAVRSLPQRPQILNLEPERRGDVLRDIETVGAATGREVVGRRAGDLPEYYADPSLANAELGWRATHTVDDMCADVWHWQSQNPNGYTDPDA